MNINRHYFSQVTHTTVTLTSASTLLCNQRKDRTFLHIGNHSNHAVFISLGTPNQGEAGIFIPKESIYEINSQNGNLYDGVIYGACKENQIIVISVVEGYGV